MEEEKEDHETKSSFRRRKKASVVDNISCCFNGNTKRQHHHRRASLDGLVPFFSPTTSSSPSSSSHRRSKTCAWFKSKSNDLPEIKGRCRSFITRMGRHRRHSSADFSYDPLSYALNFDDDAPYSPSSSCDVNFTARLPLSPPGRTKTSDRHLPRSPIPPISPQDGHDAASPRIGAGNGDLRRGFEALCVGMKEMKVVAGQRRNDCTNNRNSTDQET